MDIQTLTAFFKWCTIINGILLIFSVAVFIVAPDLVYQIHGAMFPMEREVFDAIIYAFLGFFKILFLVFNLVPYGALLIVGKKGHP